MRPLFAIAPLALLLAAAGSHRERPGLSDAVGESPASRGDWVREASSPTPTPVPGLQRQPATDDAPTVLRTSLDPGHHRMPETAYPQRLPR